MRKIYWYITAYLKKHGWVLITSVLGALILFSFSISFIVQKTKLKPHRYVGIVGKYSLHNLPLSIQNQISAGLTKLEADNTVSPFLAERWAIEDGGKTYRFIIKKNVTWQDGKVLEPTDIQHQLPEVNIITTPNDIIFKLPDEFVPFPATVSQPIFRTIEEKHLFFFKRPALVGIGRYRVDDYHQHRQRLDEITISNDTEKITYRFYFTETEAILAFKRGEVDDLPDLSSTFDVANWPNVDVKITSRPDRYLAIFFNNSAPLFPKNVRQALSYATTKPKGKERAYGPINPNSWAYLEGGKSYNKNLDRATERLLAEIPAEPLNIELTTTSNFTKQAESIKKEWEQFGEYAHTKCINDKNIKDKEKCVNTQITVNIRITNFPDTNDFQALLLGQEIPADPDQYQLWHSNQSTNFTHYKNTRIDALLEKGRKTAQKNERKAIYQEFQQFLLEDAPAIFLKHLESYEIIRK